MDASIEESKLVIGFIKSELAAHNIDSKRKLSMNNLISLFHSSAEINNNIVYCLACIKTFLQPKYSLKSYAKVSKIKFSVSLSVIPDETILKDLNKKFNFKSTATDLFIEIPKYKVNYD